MRKFFGWLFIFFAVSSLITGFTDPKLGIGGGLFSFVFWGFFGQYLIRRAKKLKAESIKQQATAQPTETAAPVPHSDMQDMEESIEFMEPAQAVQFACQSCGAKNQVQSSGGEIRCEYCDSPSVPLLPAS